jgi:branched-chain amino acid transport system substrate-binding protein
VISTTDEDLSKYEYLSTHAQKDLNEYCNKSGINTTFIFSVYSGEASAAKPLDIILNQHKQGKDLFVGGGWSSQLFVLRSFINDNKIIVVSPSSRNPQEAMLQDDYIYRLSIHDFISGTIVAHVADNIGVEKMLIIERRDSWALGVGNWFVDEYSLLGGETVGRIQYPSETHEFIEILDEAEEYLEQVSGESPDASVGVFLLAFDESVDMLSELDHYPLLSNVTWFGSEANANSLPISPELYPASMVKLISPMPLPIWSEKSREVARDYHEEFGSVLGFYDANIYDSCMVLGLSVIEADSVNASLVREVLSEVSGSFNGFTGPCGLDENGNRLVFHAGLYGIGYDPELRWMLLGYYDSPENVVTWNYD